MLKSKDFTTPLALLQWVNSKEGTSSVVSVVATENREMSSYYIWTVFYNECQHLWTYKQEGGNHMSFGNKISVCAKCGVSPNPVR